MSKESLKVTGKETHLRYPKGSIWRWTLRFHSNWFIHPFIPIGIPKKEPSHELCGKPVAYPWIFFRGFQQFDLRTEGRENGDQGAVALYSGLQLNLQMSKTHILIRFLRMYFPRSWEFGSALSKLRNFGGSYNPQTLPLGTPLGKTYGHLPRSPTWTEDLHTMRCGLVPQGGR
jgi:hypothetical protein